MINEQNWATTHFLQTGPYTDPGEYAEMLDGLPTELFELCQLIKAQLTYPKPGQSEDQICVTVREMLDELKHRNPTGITLDRQTNERLRLTCRGHAIFLAAILKHQRVPARVRVGFGEYVAAKALNKSFDHWITEVWNAADARWMFVDPDLQRVDFPRHEFELAGDVWIQGRSGTVDPEHYGANGWWGMGYIRSNLCHDYLAILNQERYYCDLPMIDDHGAEPTAEEFESLDKVARLLQEPDTHLAEIQSVRMGNRKGMPQRE